MIKAVIFDAGGVLHSAGRAQQEDLKKEFGFTDDQLAEFYQTYMPLLLAGLSTQSYKNLKKCMA